MSIAERLAQYQKPLVGGKCTVCHLLRTLPEDEAESLNAAFADPMFSNTGLSRILKAEGYSIGYSTVGRHRRAECRRQ